MKRTAATAASATTATTHAVAARGDFDRSRRKVRPVPQGRVPAPRRAQRRALPSCATPSGATSGATSGTGSGTGMHAWWRRELRALALRQRERSSQRLELR